MWNAVCNPFLECEEHETPPLKFTVNFMTCMKNIPWVVRWYRDGCDFNEKRENVRDDLRSSRLSVVMKIWCTQLKRRLDSRRFTITCLSLHFPQISLSLLHKVVSHKLKFQKLCLCWVPKILVEEHKFKRHASALDFLPRYREEGDNFLSRVVTGEDIWVLHTTSESKHQSF